MQYMDAVFYQHVNHSYSVLLYFLFCAERRNSVTAFTIGSGGRTELSPASATASRPSATVDRRAAADQELGQAALYILCEKNQSKVRRQDVPVLNRGLRYMPLRCSDYLSEILSSYTSC